MRRAFIVALLVVLMTGCGQKYFSHDDPELKQAFAVNLMRCNMYARGLAPMPSPTQKSYTYNTTCNAQNPSSINCTTNSYDDGSAAAADGINNLARAIAIARARDNCLVALGYYRSDSEGNRLE